MGRAIWEQFYFWLFQEFGHFAWSSIGSLLLISLETMHDPKEPVLLTDHAKLCLSVIMFLFACFGTQKGCAGHCLLVGRGGKFDLLRV